MSELVLEMLKKICWKPSFSHCQDNPGDQGEVVTILPMTSLKTERDGRRGALHERGQTPAEETAFLSPLTAFLPVCQLYPHWWKLP